MGSADRPPDLVDPRRRPGLTGYSVGRCGLVTASWRDSATSRPVESHSSPSSSK